MSRRRRSKPKSIMAAIEFDETTETVVQAAIDLAAATGARLAIVHVAPPDPFFVGFEAGPQEVRDQVAEERRDEHRQLQGFSRRARRRHVECQALLIAGDTVEKLVEQATALEADLVVVGRSQKSRLEKILLGTATEGLLRRLRIPILVLPPET